ncbi:MAG: hypothetical protein ACYDC8_17280 [Gammaproteobacteria bacterium]
MLKKSYFFSPPIPCTNRLPLESAHQLKSATQFERTIVGLLRKGNLPRAEVLLRTSLEKDPTNPKTFNFLGWIATAVNLSTFAIPYFREAVRLAPYWQNPRINLEKVREHLKEGKDEPTSDGLEAKHTSKAEKFLLIKAWGHGFWSDVSHVLGQLLLAEITGRVPVVHWGSNTLFSDHPDLNAFEFYFENISSVCIGDLQKEEYDFWPPKWTQRNLTMSEIYKWKGPFSRVAGLYMLSRPERVVVSDFYTFVIDLKPWIPIGHHLAGLSVDELYRYLVRRYLRPKKEIVNEVDAFYKKHLASSDFIAVHARGSDKVTEMNNLLEVNRQYQRMIDKYLAAYNCNRIFLLTDDLKLFDYFIKLYGDKVITTQCQRTSSLQGVHNHAVPSRRRLAVEVMVDVYLAAKAKAFVGNGFSNPSQIVRYLKDWSDGEVCLLGPSLYHTPDMTLLIHNR